MLLSLIVLPTNSFIIRVLIYVFSDNPLTGQWSSHEHLRKIGHTTGQFGLSKDPVQATWPPISNPDYTNKPPTHHLYGQMGGFQHSKTAQW